MLIRQCKAWLTTQMVGYWTESGVEGSVHSVFDSVANLSFPTLLGQRLFTLISGGPFRLPDSARVPADVLNGLESDTKVRARKTASDYVLYIRSDTLILNLQKDWSGKLEMGDTPIRYDCVLAAVRALACVRTGFGSLPKDVRARADEALLSAGAPECLGLGSGLTPAFDDACVGVMACCAALGYPVPFQLRDLSATTDISARYLNLALEGYFGEPLCMVMDAWRWKEQMQPALDALLTVGATSGADMLYGAVAMASAICGDCSI